jgi:N-acetylmuramoyl-L-alanine amidase
MHRILRRSISIFCTVLILCLGAFSAFASVPEEDPLRASGVRILRCTEVPIEWKDTHVGCGLMIDSVTFVPVVNFLRLMLGEPCAVEWDQETRTALIRADGFSAELDAEQRWINVNGRCLYFPDGVYNINGTILAPIRELAKIFALEVTWDEDAFSIRIEGDEPALFRPGDSYYNVDTLYWLSHVIFSESGNQPLDGMIGVGNVVLNRVRDKSGAFEDTVKDVIFQEGQFDVVEGGTIYMEPSRDAVIAAKICMEGYNIVGDCKWFLNPQIGYSSWFRTYKTFVTSIGDHDFYA